MTSRLKFLVSADIRMVARDPLLAILPFAPLLAAIALRFLMPPFAQLLQSSFGFDLLVWSDLIRGILILFPGMFYGMIAGFLLLDDRDDGLATYWGVTPVLRSGYLLARLGLFTLVALPIGLVCGLLLGHTRFPRIDDFVMATFGALQVPIYGLFLAAFAANKVEGLSIVKALGILNMAPLALFLSGPLGKIGWVVPQYWATAGFLSSTQGQPGGIPLTLILPNIGSLIAYSFSGVLFGIWILILMSRYLRRIE